MPTSIIQIVPTSEALVAAAAELLITAAEEAVATRGRFVLALSGGSTPKALYEALAAPPLRERVPWQQTLLLWGDERYVAPDHPDSNQRMAREALISHLTIPPSQVLPFPTSANNPQADAATYEATLRGALPDNPPAIDLVLLGMGPDGHTASLFPGTTALAETERLVAATYVEKLSAWRLTMTLPLLNTARAAAFLVTGADKAATARLAIDPWPNEAPPPAGRVAAQRVYWLLDQAAAQQLAP